MWLLLARQTNEAVDVLLLLGELRVGYVAEE